MISKIIFTLGFIFTFSTVILAGQVYPTGITLNSDATYCFGTTPNNITVTMSSAQTTECGTGSKVNVEYTLTLYSNTTNSTTGGTAVSSVTQNTYPGNNSVITLLSFAPPSSCGLIYYYAEITWSSPATCASNTGSVFSNVITHEVLCDCITPSSTNESHTTCGASWFDSGGPNGNYQNNESYTVTFCPSVAGDVIRVDFNSFTTDGTATTCYDPLQLWMANSNAGASDDQFCGNLASFSVISTSPDGCVTFQFTSGGSVTEAGWYASISCVTGCTNPTANMIQTAENICGPNADTPGSLTVNFDASASTAGAGWNVANYDWDFGDGTTATTGTATTSHTYSESGVFVASLTVRDNNTGIFSQGCTSTNAQTRLIRVIPQPSAEGSDTSTVTAACNTCVDLTARGTSQTYVQPLPEVSTDPVFLPDGSGVSYTSPADYSGFFPAGATVTPGCYPVVCFDLEHSYSGDLDIELISPDGTAVRLYSRALAGNNTYKFGECVNGADGDGIAGCPRMYCVVGDGTGTAWNAAGVGEATPMVTGNCAYTGTCETGNYYRELTYNSSDAFSAFDGDQLNGVWTIRITDNIGLDDGYLFGWTMTFPAACYDNLEFITPNVTTVDWVSGFGLPGTQTVTSTTVNDPGPDPCPGTLVCEGTQVTNVANICYDNNEVVHTYEYRVTDEFNCTYTRSLNVEVVCVLPVQLLEFRGRKETKYNLLTWKTASELNNSHFTLEYSIDGEIWREIAEISGAGNSSTEISYAFEHTGFLKRLNYYRLRQTDFDGETETFHIVSIDNREDRSLIRRVNLIGQEVDGSYSGIVLEYYNNGDIIKVLQ